FGDELTIYDSDEEDEDDEEDASEENYEEMERHKELIAELRRENDNSSVRCFSRACRVCNTSDPQARVVYPECGHAVCRECADETSAIMFDAELEIGCPLCGVEGGITPLYEDRIEEIDAASAPVRFSRACRVCYADHPRRRAVFSACGHVVCRACAEQLAVDADEKETDEEEEEEPEDRLQALYRMIADGLSGEAVRVSADAPVRVAAVAADNVNEQEEEED
ncbi:hypothetical protein PENTCL1PPCAC_24311, partial [Pristionchus entomophagus]